MLRALVVTNMQASAAQPARGSFVRDQVAALRRLDGVDVELFDFAPGAERLGTAALALRRRYRGERFDVVHAHFGLSAWPALAVRARRRALTLHGTDVRHPVTGRLTRAVLPRMDLVAAVSEELAREIARRAGSSPVVVLPCGVDLGRFRPVGRHEARERLGLDPAAPFVLFPADSTRTGKRHDRAVAAAQGARVVALGRTDPAEMPLWVNAANAVLVPSDAEGFGLAVLEALACDVPVLATPVGIHPTALEGIAGTHCGEWDPGAWRAALAPHLAAADPRVAGRARATLFSADAMARRVLDAWLAPAGEPPAAPLYSPAEAPTSGAPRA